MGKYEPGHGGEDDAWADNHRQADRGADLEYESVWLKCFCHAGKFGCQRRLSA